MPFSTAGMYSFGIAPPTDLVLELEALAAFLRRRSRARRGRTGRCRPTGARTCLPSHGLADRLAVGDLRLADVRLDVEFALHAVDDDLKVQLAHAGDDRLARLLVGTHAERGSSCARRDRAMPIFSWSALVFGSTAIEMTGSGNVMRSSVIDVVRRAQRIAGRDVLQADGRRDVARAHFFDFAALVGVHLQDAADALLACT